MAAGTVLVTGGSGYLAGFLIRRLIADGWSVHATIRDLAREADVRRALSTDNGRLRFFAADLMRDDGWADAVAGCALAAHVASPFPATAPRHEDDLIVPAREGTLRVLRAARDAGVRRLVVTSSAAAIAYGHGKGNRTFSERDWTNIDAPGVYPYIKSKTIAERAARDWMAAEGGGMEFCSINPTAILGPVLGGDYSTSLELVKKLLEGAFPGTPDFGFGIVDVRDLADLHAMALTVPGLDGERFAASGCFMKLNDIALVLKARLGAEARRVPTRKLPDWLVRIVARFDPMVRQVVSELGNVRDIDASHAQAVLGWRTRDEADTIEDTARSLIAQGLVKL
ncbi:NAD-dependent epimerase/dehydratase family protein [Sphingomonas colocasiae]|uniref:NAD-dependent epimerase/dehydratase family protein n=1 Tax=Sphingomonas colocasiae TaxID=1848973 RepID=A0ABS7PLC6_9SPHN|nr:NAD-dependent epimerase/dehydratase family protein [Sphingomonas colocasiae]MBY8822112.1 NAD-dependent epimerase/dehydratase family protein [Sphingomonas colocasiae]